MMYRDQGPFLFSLYNPNRKIHYNATSELNEGGFGWVYSGISGLGFKVAIKIYKPTGNKAIDLQSWLNERNILLQCLKHQYIVTTYDQFLSKEGYLVIIMEKALGSLADRLGKTGSIAPYSVCAIGTQILSALDYIHNRGIIHRDVTLQNILEFPNGNYKLSDFGISKAGLSIEELAKTFIANRSYIPPELLAAGYSTKQSDIYQLGLVLLSLLIGKQPIPPTSSDVEIRQMILKGIPRQKAESLIPKFRGLAEIISIMLRRRDQYRYHTAMEVWQDLYDEFQKMNFMRKLLGK